MGVVRALWTEGLLPRVISGASAGSIMTAIIGCDYLERSNSRSHWLSLTLFIGFICSTRSEEDFRDVFSPENGTNSVINFPEGFRVDFFRSVRAAVFPLLQWLIM